MGYSHYWERRRILPLPQFGAAVTDCRKLCQALPIPLGDGHGQNQPIFNTEEICFNGHVDSGKLTSIQKTEGLVWPNTDASGVAVIGEPDATAKQWWAGPSASERVLGPDGDGSYETFHIERISVRERREGRGDWKSDFCKTNFRPYDLAVQCCLLILNHHLGGEWFRVNSDGDSAQWNDARDACQHVLGYGVDWGEGKLAPVTPGGKTGETST